LLNFQLSLDVFHCLRYSSAGLMSAVRGLPSCCFFDEGSLGFLGFLGSFAGLLFLGAGVGGGLRPSFLLGVSPNLTVFFGFEEDEEEEEAFRTMDASSLRVFLTGLPSVVGGASPFLLCPVEPPGCPTAELRFGPPDAGAGAGAGAGAPAAAPGCLSFNPSLFQAGVTGADAVSVDGIFALGMYVLPLLLRPRLTVRASAGGMAPMQSAGPEKV
jgi:hypothetical protein